LEINLNADVWGIKWCIIWFIKMKR
jgi:hypothetical protein